MEDVREARAELSKQLIKDGIVTGFTSENNPATNHGGKLSPFSKKFLHHDEQKRQELIQHVKDVKNEKNTITTRVEYYLNLGYTQEEAEQMLKERQQTFSLNKCVEKYGEEKGRQVWQARQDKWLNTMYSKSEEEMQQIIKSKRMVSRMSKPELELLEKLQSIFPDVKGQLVLKRTDANRFFMYDIYRGNKIIEFSGDFWHGDPKRFKPDDIVHSGITAKEIWEKDEKKAKLAEHYGYKLKTVMWSEWKKNKSQIVQECIEFLTND